MAAAKRETAMVTAKEKNPRKNPEKKTKSRFVS
jgi:hypothetical protein